MEINSFCLADLSAQIENPATNLVFCGFNRTAGLNNGYEDLRAKFPNADIVSFTTSGHFIASEIHDDIPVVTTLTFEKSKHHTTVYDIADFGGSFELGRQIGEGIDADAKGVCIISDGGLINGTELMHGVNSKLVRDIPVFGGMAGDGTRFQQTSVGLNARPSQGKVVAIAFYGDALSVTSNCDSGWTALGVEFKITRSYKNELYE